MNAKFLEGLKAQLAEIDKVRNPLVDMINAVELSLGINSAGEAKNNTTSPTDYGFTSGMTFREKVQLIFKTENRFLHYREIEKIIKDSLPESEKDLKNSISPSLSFFKGNNTLVNVKIANNNLNVFWGSPKWLDANGNIKPAHMYNPEMLTTKDSKQYEI